MVTLHSEDVFTIKGRTLYHFTPVENLDVPALVGQRVIVDGIERRVVAAAENQLSTVYPKHFSLELSEP